MLYNNVFCVVERSNVYELYLSLRNWMHIN